MVKIEIYLHEATMGGVEVLKVSVTLSFLTLCDPMNYIAHQVLSLGISPGKNTGMGCHSHLQEIFPTQGPNEGLLHCRWVLNHMSHQGSPRGRCGRRQQRLHGLGVGDTCCKEESRKTRRERALVKSCYTL